MDLIYDINGDVVESGNTIIMKDMEYIAEYIEKENRWIAHPCGTNPSTEDVDLSEVDPTDIRLA